MTKIKLLCACAEIKTRFERLKTEAPSFFCCISGVVAIHLSLVKKLVHYTEFITNSAGVHILITQPYLNDTSAVTTVMRKLTLLRDTLHYKIQYTACIHTIITKSEMLK